MKNTIPFYLRGKILFRNFKAFFFASLLGFLCVVTYGCGREDKKARENQDSFLLATSVEKRVRLDSTVIGASTIISDMDVPWEITWGPEELDMVY